MPYQLKVSRKFLVDFAEIATHFQWDAATINEVKVAIRETPAMMRYWMTLAKALRDGFRQTPENNWIRLHVWLAERGERVLVDGSTEFVN